MDRKVTGVKKDRSGNIVALCNPGENWSPRRTTDVAKDISNNERSYYVQSAGRRKYIRLLASGVLQTTKDVASSHSLVNLPVC